MITLDQRGCGKGKTTDGIYNRINNNIHHNINTLVVVPSIKLQAQYAKDINSPIHIINSMVYNEPYSTHKSTTAACIHAMRNGIDTIIITHQTFVKLPKIAERSNYDLIIDEAIEEIIKIAQIQTSDNISWKPDYDLGNLFEFENESISDIIKLTPTNDSDWYQLYQYREPSASLLSESKTFKTITDKNYDHHITANGWTTLDDQTGGIADIISVLSPDILSYWKSIYIAAAAFKFTQMYHWMKSHNIETYTPSKYKFVPHDNNIKLHTSHNNKFKWSNTKRKAYPEILSAYHEYVNENKSGKILAIRNNEETTKLNDEEKLKHNVHGLNDYQHYNNVSLESALIPHPQLKKFICDNWLVSMNRTEQNKYLTHFFSAYLFYQVIMRTKLRSQAYANEQINVFVLDQDTGVAIMDYFNDLGDVGEMDITSNVIFLPRGRPQTTDELKKAKRAIRDKKYKDKKKDDGLISKELIENKTTPRSGENK